MYLERLEELVQEKLAGDQEHSPKNRLGLPAGTIAGGILGGYGGYHVGHGVAIIGNDSLGHKYFSAKSQLNHSKSMMHKSKLSKPELRELMETILTKATKNVRIGKGVGATAGALLGAGVVGGSVYGISKLLNRNKSK